ncbi:hypothetical protein ONZ45_g7720 [Pleurotus djamor]|nr:hypothetical protein ONZ45_g7720 [Pleurotus djamor]
MSDDDVQSTHNHRTAVQIAWSCAAIIFACTWSAVHPNVPSSRVASIKWKMAWRRLRMMLWTILLPEMMVAWAAKQWSDTRKISAIAQANRLPGWTQTHSYFILMGGFAVKGRRPGSWRNVTLVAGKIFIPFLEEVEIANGSKSDAVAKTIIIIQVTWFISQLCSRVNQGLVITELEIMTLAYAVICAMLYGMWFWKPYDVQRPIILEGSYESITRYRHAPITGMDVLSGTYLWIAQGRVVDDPSFADIKLHSFSTFISATVFGAIHLLACAYSSEFPTRWEYTLWVLASICVSAAPYDTGT